MPHPPPLQLPSHLVSQVAVVLVPVRVVLLLVALLSLRMAVAVRAALPLAHCRGTHLGSCRPLLLAQALAAALVLALVLALALAGVASR